LTITSTHFPYVHHLQPTSEILHNCSYSFFTDSDRCCQKSITS
jgi:hypothetical protein